MANTFRVWAGNVKKLAFRQFHKLESLGKDLFALIKNKDHKRHARPLFTIAQWLGMPFTLWRFDIAGFGRAYVQKIKNREPIDPRFVRLLEKAEALPPLSTQERVAKHEYDIQSGNHAKMLRNEAKYDVMERNLQKNPRVMRDWNEIISLFDITKFRNNHTGIVRHTHLLDRGYRPTRWEYDSCEDKEKWLFHAFFDFFCAENCLLGMEFDRPLLKRLTVIRTEFGTQITVPRYMPLNPHDDINWAEFHAIHEDEDVGWHGPKASEGQADKKALLRKFYEAHEYAKAQGWKGEQRWTHIEQECGLRPNTDRGTLRRLRRAADDLWEEENG